MKKLILMAALLVGCSAKIEHGLGEPEANQVKAVLEDNGIPATIEPEGGRDGKWRVSVAQDQASRAIRVLRDNDLPRAQTPGLGEVFGQGSMVPTATEEKAMFMRALSGEVTRSLEGLEGVVKARVIVVPESSAPGRFAPPEPARASVFLKVQRTEHVALAKRKDEIQQLVAGGVPGLAADHVAILMDEIGEVARPAVVERKDRTAAAAVGALAVALLGLLSVGLVLATLRVRKLRVELDGIRAEAQIDTAPMAKPVTAAAKRAA